MPKLFTIAISICKYYFKVVSPPLSSKYFGPADFEVVVVAVVGVNTHTLSYLILANFLSSGDWTSKEIENPDRFTYDS